MGYDIGLGFEIEMMHIIGVVALIALGVAGFMYFRSKQNATNSHIQFDDNLNEDFPRQEQDHDDQQHEMQCDNEKCSIR